MQSQHQEKNEYTREEEIDLGIIYRSIYTGAKRVYCKLKQTISFMLGRKLLILAFMIAGACLGITVFKITKSYYTSSMTLVLANIRNEFIEEQLNKLSDMIADGNYEAVAESLDISPQSARQIKEMKFINLDQNRIEEDSILTGSPFRIELSLFNSYLFGTMEPAITNYIENNRYFARQKRIKQREVENMVSKLKGEISSIDSMKTSISEPRGPVNGFIYGQPIDPTNLYREGISMFKEQVKLEADLEKLDNVEIVIGFAPRLRPTGPKLLYYLATGAILAFIIGTIVAVNLESKKHKRAGMA